MILFYEMLIIAWQKELHGQISLGKAEFSEVEQISLPKVYSEFLISECAY